MTQQEAQELAERITAHERHVKATAEPINKHNWRLRLVFRPGSPDTRMLTAGTPQQWRAIRAMWAGLPVRVGV